MTHTLSTMCKRHAVGVQCPHACCRGCVHTHTAAHNGSRTPQFVMTAMQRGLRGSKSARSMPHSWHRLLPRQNKRASYARRRRADTQLMLCATPSTPVLNLRHPHPNQPTTGLTWTPGGAVQHCSSSCRAPHAAPGAPPARKPSAELACRSYRPGLAACTQSFLHSPWLRGAA